MPAQSASVPIRSTNSLTWTIKNNVFYILEQLLCLIDGSKFSPKTPYLLENYAPVRNELYTEDLEVLGKIPDCLNGAFVRTGPNPYFDPTARYHWFDGCGMLHAVRFKGGKASYCNRFVETSRLAQEKAAGYSAGGKVRNHTPGRTLATALKRFFV